MELTDTQAELLGHEALSFVQLGIAVVSVTFSIVVSTGTVVGLVAGLSGSVSSGARVVARGMQNPLLQEPRELLLVHGTPSGRRGPMKHTALRQTGG
jgi:hypothetical protein